MTEHTTATATTTEEFVFVEHPDRCDGCYDKTPDGRPMPWRSLHPRLGIYDYYCERCYREFRKIEVPEEAVIKALKEAMLDQTHTPEALQQTLDGLCGLEPESFNRALERGTSSTLERSPEVKLRRGARAGHGRAQAARDAQGRHAA